MIYKNCLFCKIRSGVLLERVKNSAKNNGLEILVVDGENCLMRFVGTVPNSMSKFVDRLKNTLLFSSIIYSANAFISSGIR